MSEQVLETGEFDGTVGAEERVVTEPHEHATLPHEHVTLQHEALQHVEHMEEVPTTSSMDGSLGGSVGRPDSLTADGSAASMDGHVPMMERGESLENSLIQGVGELGDEAMDGNPDLMDESRITSPSQVRPHKFVRKSQEHLQELLNMKHNRNTYYSTQTAIKILREYCTEINVNPIFEEIEINELNKVLESFYANVRKKDGEEYKQSTFIAIRGGLTRYLLKDRGIDLIHDPAFTSANQTFKGCLRESNRVGKGKAEHWPKIDTDDLYRLYTGKCFDIETPQGLQNKALFDVLFYLCRRRPQRAKDNVLEMTKHVFVVRLDATGRKYVCHSNASEDGDSDMIVPVGRRGSTDSTAKARMYEKEGHHMCPVLTFELYLSKLSPEVDILWQRPMTQPVSRSTPIWFTAHTLSKNYMRHFMATLSKSASLTRIYTSNSIPQTPVSALDEAYFYRESRVPVEAIVQKSPPKPRAPRRNSKAQGGGSSSVHAGAVAGGVMPSLPSPPPLPVGMVGLPSIASIKAEQQAQQVQQVQVLKTQQSLHSPEAQKIPGFGVFLQPQPLPQLSLQQPPASSPGVARSAAMEQARNAPRHHPDLPAGTPTPQELALVMLGDLDSELSEEVLFSDSSGRNHPDINQLLQATEKLDNLSPNKPNVRTQYATQSAVKALREYCVEIGVDERFEMLGLNELNLLLQTFYANMRKKDGEKYKLNTFTAIRYGLARHLHADKGINILTDTAFASANQVFKAAVAALEKTGKGEAEHWSRITNQDLYDLYTSSAMSLSTPQGLQNKVLFDVMFFLCRNERHSNKKLSEMTKDTLEIRKDHRDWRYVCYCNATEQGSIQPRMYARPGDQRCPVMTYEMYVSKLHPEVNSLWQCSTGQGVSLNDTYWYLPYSLSKETLRNFLANACKLATLTNIYTNSSIFRTPQSALDEAYFSPRMQETNRGTDQQQVYSALQFSDKALDISSLSTTVKAQPELDSLTDETAQAQQKMPGVGVFLHPTTNTLPQESLPMTPPPARPAPQAAQPQPPQPAPPVATVPVAKATQPSEPEPSTSNASDIANSIESFASALQETGQLCDVHLQAELPDGSVEELPAHKLLLAFYCGYFKGMFCSRDASATTKLYLPGLPYTGVKMVVDYIYKRLSLKTILDSATALSVAAALGLNPPDSHERALLSVTFIHLQASRLYPGASTQSEVATHTATMAKAKSEALIEEQQPLQQTLHTFPSTTTETPMSAVHHHAASLQNQQQVIKTELETNNNFGGVDSAIMGLLRAHLNTPSNPRRVDIAYDGITPIARQTTESLQTSATALQQQTTEAKLQEAARLANDTGELGLLRHHLSAPRRASLSAAAASTSQTNPAHANTMVSALALQAGLSAEHSRLLTQTPTSAAAATAMGQALAKQHDLGMTLPTVLAQASEATGLPQPGTSLPPASHILPSTTNHHRAQPAASEHLRAHALPTSAATQLASSLGGMMLPAGATSPSTLSALQAAGLLKHGSQVLPESHSSNKLPPISGLSLPPSMSTVLSTTSTQRSLALADHIARHGGDLGLGLTRPPSQADDVNPLKRTRLDAEAEAAAAAAIISVTASATANQSPHH